MSGIVRYIAMFVLLGLFFLSGCDALTCSPDTWLDPDRWIEKEEAAYTKTLDEAGMSW